MRTTEEITKKIREMMEEELKETFECEEARKYWQSCGDFEMEEFWKNSKKRYIRGYATLSELLDWINEK